MEDVERAAPVREEEKQDEVGAVGERADPRRRCERPNHHADDHDHSYDHDHDHDPQRRHSHSHSRHHGHYKVYKRRWFGLLQLMLLNIIVSWDWLTFSAVSADAATYFGVSEGAINWLSTAFLFAFVAICPLVILTIHRGPKPAILATSVLILLGNWIRYAGARATGGHFGVVMFGQILVGLAQPFVLAAPTRYSDLWFTERGRISATALASLANPLGGALGQLIGPIWATKPSEVPNMVLYTAIISTIAALPSLFIPSAPPTPPTASTTTTTTTTHAKTPLLPTLHALAANPSFYLLLLPFSIYVALFNSTSTLLSQILTPYSFSTNDAGIAGALLIFVGLGFAAITSPLLDRCFHPKPYLWAIKTLCPVVAAMYVAFVFAPDARTTAAPFAVLAILGAASFALVPVALEFLVEVAWPVGPEVGSTACWAGGQLFGAIFIIIMNAMKEPSGGAGEGDEKTDDGTWSPPGSMWKALVFQAVVAVAVLPAPLLLGVRRLGLGRGRRGMLGRMEAEEAEEEDGARAGDEAGEGVGRDGGREREVNAAAEEMRRWILEGHGQ